MDASGELHQRIDLLLPEVESTFHTLQEEAKSARPRPTAAPAACT